jgi:hypothetical protein
MVKIRTLTGILSFVFTASAAAETVKYTVRARECLSEIAFRNLGYPVYGKDGSLARLFRMNPNIRNPHLIYPGMSLQLIPLLSSPEVAVIPDEPMDSSRPENPVEVSPGAERIISSEEDDPRSTVSVFTGFDYFHLEAVDTATQDTAKILSEASPRVVLGWRMAWDEKWSTEVDFTYRQDRLKQPQEGPLFKKKTFARTGFTFGVNRHWEKGRTKFFLGRSERGFLRAPNASSIEFESATSTDVGLAHEQALVVRKTASAGVSAEAIYLGAADASGYSTDPGLFLKFGLFMRHQLSSLYTLEARGHFGVWEQDSPYVNQEVKETGAGVNLTREL